MLRIFSVALIIFMFFTVVHAQSGNTSPTVNGPSNGSANGTTNGTTNGSANGTDTSDTDTTDQAITDEEDTSANMSPVGYWMSISERIKKPTGVVQIYEKDGMMYGKIAQVFTAPGKKPVEFCTNCPGEFKNKKLIGLTLLWDMKPKGSGRWTNGSILEPISGKIFQASMRLMDNGKKLQIRGYSGFLWRTQVWEKVDKFPVTQ